MLGMKTKKDRDSDAKKRKRSEFVAEIRSRLLKVAEATADEALEQIQDLIIRRVEKAEVRAEARAHAASRRSSARTHTPKATASTSTTTGTRRRSGRKPRR